MRRLSVVNSRHPVLARIKKQKKSPKISGNALSDALLMWYFQILAADAAIENSASRGFFWTHSNKKSAQLIPDSYQKACWIQPMTDGFPRNAGQIDEKMYTLAKLEHTDSLFLIHWKTCTLSRTHTHKHTHSLSLSHTLYFDLFKTKHIFKYKQTKCYFVDRNCEFAAQIAKLFTWMVDWLVTGEAVKARLHNDTSPRVSGLLAEIGNSPVNSIWIICSISRC